MYDLIPCLSRRNLRPASLVTAYRQQPQLFLSIRSGRLAGARLVRTRAVVLRTLSLLWMLLLVLVPTGLRAQSITSTLAVGAAPRVAVLNPVTNLVYVPNNSSGTVSVIDGATNTVTQTITVGSGPFSIAVNPGTNTVYVTNSNSNTVSVINGATNAVTATVAVGSHPQAIAVNPATNTIYVANYSGVSVSVMNGSTNAVTSTVGVGAGPIGIGINPVSNTVYVANFTAGTVSVINGSTETVTTSVTAGTKPSNVAINPVTNTAYVTNNGSGTVSVIDGSTNAVASTVTVGANPSDIAVNSVTNTVYAGNNGTNTVSVINGSTNTVTSTVTVGSAPEGVAVNPVTNMVYVANWTSGTVSVINGSTNAVASTLAVGSQPYGVGVNITTNDAYVVNYSGNSVSVINGSTNQVTATVSVGSQPVGVCVNNATDKVYATNALSNTVSVINGSTNVVTATINVGSGPYGVDVNPVTNTVYVANASSNTVSVINGSTNAVTAGINVGSNPMGLAVDAATNTVYVENNVSNTVSVINGATNAVTATIPAGSSPAFIAVNSATNTVYVSNSGAGTVSVINGATNTVTALITVGGTPRGIAVNPATNTVYVANLGSNTVSVISGATNAVMATISVGSMPVGIGVNPSTNTIYVSNFASETVSVIDGATNAVIATVGAGEGPNAVAVNPITNMVYVPNDGSDNVSVISPWTVASIPVTLPINGVTDAYTISGNSIWSTSSTNPSFTSTVTSNFSPTAPAPSSLYYQLDTSEGAFAAATETSAAGSNPGTFSFSLSGVLPGVHYLYAYSGWGEDATVTSGLGNDPKVSNLQVFTFLKGLTPTTTTLTADTNPQTYGDTVNFTATVAPQTGSAIPTGTVTFKDGATTLGTETLSGGSATYGLSTLAAGTHSISAVYSGDAANAASSGAMSEVITKAPLTITASSSTVNFGAAVPTITPTYSGFENGDTLASLTTAPTCTTTYTATSHPGSYPTSCSGAVDANYTIGYVAGSVTVSKATPTVSTWPTASAITYGQTLASSTLTGGSGLVGGSFSWTAPTTGPPAGTQSESVTFTPTDTTDYNTVTGSINVTVNKAPLSITASSSTLTYGSAVPTITPSYTGFVNGDTASSLTTPPTCTTTYTVTSHPASYSTSCSGAVDSNYTISYVAGSVTESKATPTVSTWPTASSIAAGQTLASSTLSGGSGSVGGSFAWTTPTTAPGAGTPSEGVTFTPTDTTDYNTVAGTINVTVVANPVVGMGFVPSAISLNGVSTLTLTIFNPSPNTMALTGVAFTSSLPTGMVVASPNGLTSSCGGTATAVAGSGIVSLTGGTANAGSSCTLSANVTPTLSGTLIGSATASSTNGGTGNTASASLVVTPVTLSASTISFGSTVVGTTSAAQNVTLTNNSAGIMVVSSVSATGDFGQTNNCTTIAAGSNCTIAITFTPTTTGTRTGALIVSDSGGTQVVMLSGTGTQAGVSLSPSSLAFGSTVVGATAAAQSVTLTNTGSSPLNISALSSSGDFALGTGTTCSTSMPVAASGTCTIAVTFAPTASGTRTGVLTILDNASGGTQTIALSGTGAVAGVSLNPSSLTFGSTVVGTTAAAQSVTLTNTGTSVLNISSLTASGDFALGTGTTCSTSTPVAASGTCTIAVTFTPAASGTRTGVVTIADNVNGGLQTITLSGTGAVAGVSLNPSSLTFGSTVVGTTAAAQSVTITNTGSSPLNISSLTSSGDFALDPSTTCSTSTPVVAGGSCIIAVNFTPVASGTRTGGITISDNSSGGTQIITLTGTGIASGVSLSPSNLTFGSTVVGTTAAAQSVTLTNTGTSLLNITALAASGDFALEPSTTCSNLTAVASGQSCTIAVAFTPTASGVRTGGITITDDASGGIQNISLSGTGTTPGASLNPSSLSFGSTVLGTTAAAQSATLTNTGSSPLTISALAASGDFALGTGTCSTSTPIAAGGSCTVAVTFTPTSSGTRTGVVTISDNAGGGTQTVTLSGSAIAPGVTLTPSSLTFGSTVVGTTAAAQSVTLTNTGTSSLNITALIASGDFALGTGTTCSTSTPVTAGDTCTIAVTFTPTASGTRTSVVTISDNASGGTQVVTLTGNGTVVGVSLNPSGLTFGSTVVGTTAAAQSVTLTNTGASSLSITALTASGDFALGAGTTCSISTPIAASGTCTIAVTFTPTANGTRSGVVTITDNASGGTQTVTLSGTGTAPGVSLNPSSLTFGSTVVGTTAAAKSVTLTNTGTSSLNITGVTTSGDFALDPSTTCSISNPVTASGTCAIAIDFSPILSGLRSGLVVLNTNAGIYTITLTGTGSTPVVSLNSTNLIFGSQTVGTTSGAESVTVTNDGTSPVSFASFSISGDFAVDGGTTTCSASNPLSAGSSCDLGVTFTPTAASSRTGTLTIGSNVGTSNVSLAGTGTLAGVSLSPSTLTFGSTVAGTAAAAQTVTLTNTGSSPLDISALTISGNFAFDPSTTCSTSAPVSAGSTCVIAAAFTPVASGTQTGVITISDNASGGTQTIALSGVGTAPGVSVTPSSLAFGSTVVGTTAAAQSVTLTNTGTSSLTITALAATGDFALDASSTCSTSTPVAVAQSCTIAVTFAPTANGVRTGIVTITDNASGGIQTITLNGTGTLPGVSLSPSNLTFGSTVVGTTAAAQSVMLTNTGSSPLNISALAASGDFALDASSTCSTSTPVAAGATCTIAVTFAPSGTGVRTGVVTINDDASGGIQTITLSGTGTAPGVSLSPSNLAFGSTVVGNTSIVQSVTLTNTGQSPLNIAALAASGDFTLAGGTTCSISTPVAASGTCEIAVSFTPTASGTRTGVVTITDNASSGTQTIMLTGNGTAAGVSLNPSSLTFGSTVVGATSGPQSVILTNSGTSSLSISALSAGGDFALDASTTCSTSSPAAASGTCMIAVDFSPTASGLRSGLVVLNTNAGTYVITLGGTGVVPALTLNSANLTFGSQTVGTTSGAQSVTLTNTGSAAESFSSFSASGDFSVDSTTTTCSTSGVLSVGSSCDVGVTFMPTTTGARTGTLAIVSDLATSNVNLSGMGISAGVSLNPSSLSFGSTVIGTTAATQSVTLTNTGSSALTIAALNASGDFALDPSTTCSASSPVPAGSTCLIAATFSPVASGVRTGVVTITDNASGGTQNIALSGAGTAAGVTLTPSNLTFGSTVIGTTATAQSVTLTNTGTSSLSITALAASGDFALDAGSTCSISTPVAAGNTCTIAATFTPTATGVRTGVVTITDNASGGAQIIALTGTGTAPGVTLAPSSLTFGSTVVGTTTAVQSVTLNNTGTSALTISALAASGDFALDPSTTCSTSSPVAASGTCTIAVTFSPTAIGSRTGTVTISDNAGGGTQTITLSGSGTAPGVSLNPSSLTFGNTLVGATSAAQSVTLTNTGSSPLTINTLAASSDFSLGAATTCSTSSPVAASGTCTIAVDFTPTAAGIRSGLVLLNTNAGTYVLTLTGSGMSPTVVLDSGSLTFGSQSVGTTSSAQSLTLTNNGSTAVNFTSFTISGDFNVDAGTTTCTTSSALGAGASCSIGVTFGPSSQGSRTGILNIVSSAGTNSASLYGTGIAAGVSLTPSSLTFGSTVVGTTGAAQSVVLTNTGSTSLTITAISASGDFALDASSTCSTSTPVAAGANCIIAATFTPRADGPRAGMVTINDNASGGTQNVALNGTGIAPGISLSPSNLTFGSTVVGTTAATQSVTLTNSGSSPLTITALEASGDFAFDPSTTCSISSPVAVASTCTIAVTFTPTASGTRTGVVTISDDASGGTQTITLTGSGTAPGVSLIPSNLIFGSTVVGTTATAQSVTLINTGSSTLTINSLIASGDFALDPSTSCSATSPVAVSGNCTIAVTFTPTASGVRTGVITITDSARGGTQIIALSGTGTAPGVSLTPSSLTFGSTVQGTAATAQSVTLTNTGSSALQISALSASGDFALAGGMTCSTLTPVAASATCTIAVTFTPTATGVRTGAVTISDDASGGTQTITLTGSGTAPGVSLSPSTLTFSSTVVGMTSGPQSVMLTNTGGSSLSISALSAGGDFAIDPSTTCSIASPVAASSTCSIAIDFWPTASGLRSGLVVLNTNAGTYVVTLAGSGAIPIVALSSANLVFGSQTLGTTSTAETLTVTNNGSADVSFAGFTASGDFNVDTTTTTCSTSTSLAPGLNCAVGITFTPSATGARTGTLSIASSVGTSVVGLSGSGTAPGVTLAPSSLSFGGTVVGTSTTAQSVTLSNTGSGPLTISAIAASGDFAISSGTTCSTSTPVVAGGTCVISVIFTPRVVGSRTGVVIIGDNASGGTQNIALTGTGTAPGVSLNPSGLTFGSTAMGTTSAAQSVTLTNAGTSPLYISALGASGDFALDPSTTCSTSTPVTAGGTCVIAATFTPVASGVRTGVVTINDNAGGGTQTIALSGTGTAPGVSLGSSSLSFGSQTVGVTSSAQSLTVTNNGTAAVSFTSVAASGDFSVDGPTTTCSTASALNAGATCVVGVTFAPTATGVRSGTLSIVSGIGTNTAALTGTGIAPGISLSPSSLTFGSTVVGTTAAAQSVTLTNSGSSALTITALNASGDFALDPSTTCSTSSPVPAGSTCLIAATFSPVASGVRTGVITITDNASGGTQTIALSGTGAAPGVTLTPSSLTFGSTVVGTTATAQSVTLTNSGTSSLSITALAASGDFALDAGTTCSISTPVAAGNTCTIAVTFTPTASGVRTGVITITDNASGGAQTIALTGTGTAPGVTLTPSSLTFGSTLVGTTAAAQPVTLTNSGTSSLSITALASSGDFVLDPSTTCSTSTPLTASGTCTIAVTFTPTTSGTRTGVVMIRDNASGGTQTITLSGSGSAPGVSLTPSSLAFGSTLAGATSAAQSVTLTNTGSSPLTITTLTASGDFALDPSTTCSTSSPVAASGSCMIAVDFTPTAAGIRSGIVVVKTNAGTYVINLSGTGALPEVELSAGSLSFGSQTVGTTSSAQSLTITNTGTSAVSFTSFASSGDFSVDGPTTTCSISGLLNAGSSCDVGVTFTPVATGLRTGTLSIVSSVGTSTAGLSGTGISPGVLLTPSSQTFGSTVVGTTAAAQSVTLTNSGGSALTITAISASGDFALDPSTTCSTSIPVAASGTCTIAVTFTPSTTGIRTGIVSINDNASGGTQSVALNGTGIVPGISLSPSSLTFGSTVVGTTAATQSVTLTNTGSSPLTITALAVSGDFALDASTTCSTSSPVPAGSTCLIAAMFSPAASGVRTGVITITDNASGGTQSIALSGAGIAPGVTLTPSSLTFGSTVVGTTAAAQSVTLTNTGSSPLTIRTLAVSGDFALDPSTTCSTSSPVPAGSTCLIAATFSPVASGVRTAVITITDNASGGTQSIALSGTGTTPGITLTPSSLSFGSTVNGTTATAQSVTLTNAGTSPLSITALVSSGDFALDSSTTCSISTPVAAGNSCTIAVTFTPTSSGVRTGVVTITDNASGGAQTIALTGTGTAPGVTLTPSSLTFGSTVVGTTAAAQSVTLTNAGTSPLSITALVSSGDFALDPSTTCSTSTPLAASGTCIIAVTFSPTASGTRTGVVMIRNNASGGTQTIAISGSGIAAGVSLNPSNLAFATTTLGVTTPPQPVTLTNTGTGQLNISGLTASGDFALDTSTTCSISTPIAASGTCTIAVTFTPTAGGTRTGVVTISDNASGGIQTIVLVGSGAGTTISSELSLSPTSLSFGDQAVATTSPASTITVTNVGSTATDIAGIAATGDFSLDAATTTCSTSIALGAGSSCNVGVTFTPVVMGSRTGTLSINSNAGTGSAGLLGNGTAPAISLNPSSLSFTSTGVGWTTAAQSIVLTNTGTSQLNISKLTASGDFALNATGTCSTSTPVAAAGACTIAVTFNPTATGTRTGVVTITDNVSGGTQTIALAGTGTASTDFSLSLNGSGTQTVTSGNTATYLFTVAPLYGQYSGTVNFSVTGLPSGATATFSPSSVAVNGETQTITLTVQTSTTSAMTSPLQPGRVWPLGMLAILLIPFSCRRNIRRQSRKLRNHAGFLFLALLSILSISAVIAGCGGKTTGFAESSATNTYALTVTATSGNSSQSANVILTVK